MKTSLLIALLLCIPLVSSEALPPPSTPVDELNESPFIQTHPSKCEWMLTKYDCVIVTMGKQVFLIYRDKKGAAYQWKINPDGGKSLKWVRDDLSI